MGAINSSNITKILKIYDEMSHQWYFVHSYRPICKSPTHHFQFNFLFFIYLFLFSNSFVLSVDTLSQCRLEREEHQRFSTACHFMMLHFRSPKSRRLHSWNITVLGIYLMHFISNFVFLNSQFYVSDSYL